MFALRFPPVKDMAPSFSDMTSSLQATLFSRPGARRWERIHLQRVRPEHLRTQRCRDLRIAVPVAQLRRDLERAEGLDA